MEKCLLVNPNRMLPPIAPLGLDYIAVSLQDHGYEPALCDLVFESQWRRALHSAIQDVQPSAIGFSVRNIDDAYFASQDFVLQTTREMVQYAMSISSAHVILGGVGFSAAPREILKYTGATMGIAGEGEEALPRLLDCLMRGGDATAVPGLVYRTGDGTIVANPAVYADLSRLRTGSRNFVDNQRYYAEGGQAGLETLRGCPNACIYCIDPPAKGRHVRTHPVRRIVAEFKALLDQGIDTVHLCDSEFNLVPEHAKAWCAALVESGMADHVRWYAYASVVPFDEELAFMAKRAGCAGINFGVDHGHPEMLRRLRRSYSVDDIRAAARSCKANGVTLMFDTLLGTPGETRDTIAATIDLMRECAPDRVGLSCGVRVYPGTELARFVSRQGDIKRNPNLHGQRQDNEDLLRPIFYVDAAVADIDAYVASLVRGDERFLHADPSEIKGNYNYNNNSVLSRAIRKGARGAYWDILRKQQ